MVRYGRLRSRATRSLGIANTDLDLVMLLTTHARVKPAVVQNRFYAGTGYDCEMRDFCHRNSILYQAYWTLTANQNLLNSECVKNVAVKVALDHSVALFGLILALGSTAILNGTTNRARMAEDLSGIRKLLLWEDENAEEWHKMLLEFKFIIGHHAP